MKKTTLLVIALLLVNTFVSAATGWFDDFLTIKVNGVETANNYYIGTDPSSGTALQGATLGSVTSLQISGCDMKYWSDTQDRTGGSFFYKIMSADGNTQVVAPIETIWDQVALGGNDFQGTKTLTINLLNGLPYGSYQLHVWAKTWGNNQGDSWLSNNSANYVATFTYNLPVMVYGSNVIADGTGYSNLKAAFDALNLVADQTGKNIEIKISGNTTETATAALNQPSTASWTSLTIYPTATATISGSFVGTLIDLTGADNVTFNGRLNKNGTTKSLIISQTEATDNTSRTIRFFNDAKNNTLQYCTVIGKCPSTGAGVIFFSTTTGTDGNDDNIIEYCDINAMGEAAVGIGSAGTADKSNSGNIIRNNNIFDFYLGSTSTNATYGINIGANNTDWTISGNSLYQTASRSYNATTGVFHYGIYVSAATGSGVNFTITDNYIGGSAPMAGGTAWTVSGGLGRPNPLYTSVGTTTASSVQNNTIANFDITSDFVTNGSSAFIGYWHAAGSVNAGTVKGNTIGSSTSTGSIVVKYNSAAVGALTVGMNIVTGATATMVFSNNKIGGIIVDYLNTVNRGHLYAVSTSGAGALTFTNNTIGSTTVANSIEHKGSTYTGGQVNLRAINMGHTVATTLTGNTIANITATSTGSMAVNGIFHNGAGVNNISNNTIRDIKSFGTRVIATQGIDASLIGIVLNNSNAGNIVGGNTIYNLENTNTTLATDVYGINFHSIPTAVSVIENNKIYNLTTASTNTAANVVGISITRGLTTTRNNMITLGTGITNAVSIVGIRKLGTAATQNNNFYHNTVLITGSNVGVAGASSTAAFARVYTATDEVKSNIFINNRSNASGNTQKHYAINVDVNTTLTSNDNLLYTGGSVLGVLGTTTPTDYADLAAWKTGTVSLDVDSKSGNVSFMDAVTGDLSIASTSYQDANLQVVRLATVLTDKFGASRDGYTYSGAHQAQSFIINAASNPIISNRIMHTANGIEVVVDGKAAIELYSVNGLLIEKTSVNKTYNRNLDNGVYIIRIDGKAVKFVK